MPTKRQVIPVATRKRYYSGADVPMRVIRRYVREVADRSSGSAAD